MGSKEQDGMRIDACYREIRMSFFRWALERQNKIFQDEKNIKNSQTSRHIVRNVPECQRE